MTPRLIGVVGFTDEGFPEIEESFDVVHVHPIYAVGHALPVKYVQQPSSETRRRIATDPIEIAGLKERYEREGHR